MARSFLSDKVVNPALNHPKGITRVMVTATVLLLALAALPNFVDVPYLQPIRVDTDPENLRAPRTFFKE